MKFKGLVLPILCLFLLGCEDNAKNKATEVKFDDNIEVGKQLAGNDLQILIKKVTANYDKVSSIESQTYTSTETNLNQEKTESTTLATFHNDYSYYWTTTRNLYRKYNGIVFNNMSTTSGTKFESKLFKTILTYQEADGDISFYRQDYSEDQRNQVLASFYSSAFDSFFGYRQLTSYSYFHDGDGYIGVSSSRNVTVTPETWGNETKEYHNNTYNQTILRINKDYELEEFKTINEIERNKDSETNEWYEKTKLVSSSKSIYKFSYNARGDNTKKDSIISKFVPAYLSNFSINLTWDNMITGETYHSVAIKRASTRKLHFSFFQTINYSPDSDKFKLKTSFDATIMSLDKADATNVSKDFILFLDENAHYEGEYIVISNARSGMIVNIECDVELTNDNKSFSLFGASLSVFRN